MDEEMTIDQYIAKMMMEGEFGGHSEIVAFSEIYSVQIHIFNSIASQEPITPLFNTKFEIEINN